VDRLTVLPEFYLPPASAGHTRHYMPKHPGNPDLVFDAFVTIAPDTPVVVVWPDLGLATDEGAVLHELLSALTYFGRAESWVEARYLNHWSGEINCRLAVEGTGDSPGERVPVIAAVPPEDYAAWRDLEREKTASAADELAKVAKTKPSRSRKPRATVDVPDDLFAALHAETTDLRKQGWSFPPGARTAYYLRPPDALAARPPRSRRPSTRKPTVARYALHSAVLPSLTEALPLGERTRRALMSWSDASPVFAGKNGEGAPLPGHQHAFILPADDDDDGRIDHIVVYCREGFGATERRALGGLRRLWQPGGRPDLSLILLNLGEPEDFGGFDAGRDESLSLAASRVWCSRTPFVLVRHPKRHRDGSPKLRPDATWIDGPEDQLRRELSLRGLPQPVAVEPVRGAFVRGRDLTWLHFRRQRQSGGGREGMPGAFGFRLEFEKPIAGPLALGYGAHFGLGQFVAAPSA
jgi:CRISPR-associated protein Csb2